MGRKVIFCCRRGNALVTTNPSYPWNAHIHTHTQPSAEKMVSFIICQITHGQSVLTIPTYVLAHLIKVLYPYTDPQFSHRNLIPRTARLPEAPAPAALFHMCPESRSKAVSNLHFWGDMSNSLRENLVKRHAWCSLWSCVYNNKDKKPWTLSDSIQDIACGVRTHQLKWIGFVMSSVSNEDQKLH